MRGVWWCEEPLNSDFLPRPQKYGRSPENVAEAPAAAPGRLSKTPAVRCQLTPTRITSELSVCLAMWRSLSPSLLISAPLKTLKKPLNPPKSLKTHQIFFAVLRAAFSNLLLIVFEKPMKKCIKTQNVFFRHKPRNFLKKNLNCQKNKNKN